MTLAACQKNQVAQESDQHKRGLFTHFVLDGLRSGRADLDGDGSIDTDELFSFVRRGVAKASRQTQQPHKTGSGRVVLGRTR